MKISNIIVAQPQPAELEKSPFSSLAAKHGLNITYRPFTKIEGVSHREYVATHIDITEYAAVMFTSKIAAEHYFRICEKIRFAVPDTMKYYCLSEQIANYLQKFVVFRKRKIFFANTPDPESLLQQIEKHRNIKILLPLSDTNKPEITKVLDKMKFSYTKIVLYRTVFEDLSDLDINKFQIVVCYSPSDIKSLAQNFPDFQEKDIKLACFGQSTIKAAKSANYTAHIQCPKPGITSMAMAIDLYLKNQKND